MIYKSKIARRGLSETESKEMLEDLDKIVNYIMKIKPDKKPKGKKWWKKIKKLPPLTELNNSTYDVRFPR